MSQSLCNASLSGVKPSSSVLSRLRERVDRTFSVWQWWGLAVLAYGLFRVVMSWLEGQYALSLHPATVFAGQTTFDAEAIRYFYAVMQEKGTLGQYVYVQVVDYGFMVTMFLALASATIAAYRSLPQYAWLKNVGWVVVLIAPLAPMFDALENAVSFFMLASPTDFAAWLAYPYSTFAVVKFGLSGLGFVWAALVAVLALIGMAVSFVIKGFQRP